MVNGDEGGIENSSTRPLEVQQNPIV